MQALLKALSDSLRQAVILGERERKREKEDLTEQASRILKRGDVESSISIQLRIKRYFQAHHIFMYREPR